MRPIRIALTKGRLEKETIRLFEKIGIDCEQLKEKGRRLIIPIGEEYEIILAKAADVITYIEHGACDIGIVGKDTIMEFTGTYFEVLDLGFGKCRLALATLEGTDIYQGYKIKTIATKYPNIANNYFQTKDMDVQIIKIEGSVELAPLLPLADAIVDIVETGETLRENGLVVLEDIHSISARMIINHISMKLYKTKIDSLVKKIEAQLEKENSYASYKG